MQKSRRRSVRVGDVQGECMIHVTQGADQETVAPGVGGVQRLLLDSFAARDGLRYSTTRSGAYVELLVELLPALCVARVSSKT